MIEEILERLQTSPPRIGPFARWTEDEAALRYHGFQHARLRYERLGSRLFPFRSRPRIASTACWEFPIYSQTFVYQELDALARNGFDLRFFYSKLNSRSHLPAQFSPVWRSRRKLVLHHAVCEQDYAWYRQRMPKKVESLIAALCSASGLSEEELRNHYHFRQAFAFTRTVEACRPDYLHSYFFYEGTLFGLIASWLLDIPRGVSCYADHMLDDYALKVVPLHLEQCSLVIATSARIKRELTSIAPNADPDRILVKPNAIDARRFPAAVRPEPANGQPFHLTCVSRIEPKKGILYLADAVDYLRKHNIDVVVHVLGGIDNNDACRAYAGEVEKRIAELGIGQALRLEGRRDAAQVRQFLQQSHLFVAPFVETETGDKDGIPTSLLEAMATGLPAVATDAGSITEVIRHGQDGLIVPQRDGAALGEAVASLLTDSKQRREMSRKAAERIRQAFDIQVCEKAFHQRIRMLRGASSSHKAGGNGRQ